MRIREGFVAPHGMMWAGDEELPPLYTRVWLLWEERPPEPVKANLIDRMRAAIRKAIDALREWNGEAA